MGQYMRKRFSNILSKNYSPKESYIRSSGTDRTIMTALAALAGLYFPTKNEIWNDDILWQPIPVHTLPINEDYILIGESPCPRFDELFEKFLKESELAREMHAKVAEFYPILSERSGKNISTIFGTFLFFDTLYVENLHNKT